MKMEWILWRSMIVFLGVLAIYGLSYVIFVDGPKPPEWKRVSPTTEEQTLDTEISRFGIWRMPTYRHVPYVPGELVSRIYRPANMIDGIAIRREYWSEIPTYRRATNICTFQIDILRQSLGLEAAEDEIRP